MTSTKHDIINLYSLQDDVRNKLDFFFKILEARTGKKNLSVIRKKKKNPLRFSVFFRSMIYFSFASMIIMRIAFILANGLFTEKMFNLSMTISVIFLYIGISTISFFYMINWRESDEDETKKLASYSYVIFAISIVVMEKLFKTYFDLNFSDLMRVTILLPFFLAIIKFSIIYLKNKLVIFSKMSIKEILLYFLMPDFIMLIIQREKIIDEILHSEENKKIIMENYDAFFAFNGVILIDDERSRIEFFKSIANIIFKTIIFFLPIIISVAIFLEKEIREMLKFISGGDRLLISLLLSTFVTFLGFIIIYLIRQFLLHEKKRQIGILMKEMLFYTKISSNL